MCARAPVCQCACVPGRLCASVPACLGACAPVCLCACVPVCMCARVPMCPCACVHVCMCARAPTQAEELQSLCSALDVLGRGRAREGGGGERGGRVR
eukprot:2797060-Pleurochrysis_carterae.AAC.1